MPAFDLDSNPKADLLAIAHANRAAAQVAAPQTIPVSPVPASEPIAQIPPVNAVVSPAAEPKKDEPVVPPVTAEPAPIPPSTDQSIDVEEPLTAWDADISITTAVQDAVPLTLEDISRAIKLPAAFKNTEQLVEHYGSLTAKIAELEKGQISPLDSLPDELKEIVKVAQGKGDWKRFVGTVIGDYSNVDPVALFEAEVERDPRFRDAQGKLDEDSLSAELASIPQSVKFSQGNLMKRQLMFDQQQRRQQLAAESDRKATEFNRSIGEAVKKLPSVLSQEKFGIKLEAKHSDFIYDGIRSNKLVEKHLGRIDISGADTEKLARTLALAEFGENISKHQLSQGIVKGKRDILKSTQNVQLNPTAVPPTPNAPSTKVETPADKLKKMVGRFTTPGQI